MNADVFVSIHANSTGDKSTAANGTETYSPTGCKQGIGPSDPVIM
ncbi:hypothetical protein VQ056_21535 [Paenibacillus sp. JTLBN-2024]